MAYSALNGPGGGLQAQAGQLGTPPQEYHSSPVAQAVGPAMATAGAYAGVAKANTPGNFPGVTVANGTWDPMNKQGM